VIKIVVHCIEGDLQGGPSAALMHKTCLSPVGVALGWKVQAGFAWLLRQGDFSNGKISETVQFYICSGAVCQPRNGLETVNRCAPLSKHTSKKYKNEPDIKGDPQGTRMSHNPRVSLAILRYVKPNLPFSEPARGHIISWNLWQGFSHDVQPRMRTAVRAM